MKILIFPVSRGTSFQWPAGMYLAAMLLGTILFQFCISAASRAQNEGPLNVDEVTREQAQQVIDNFQALRTSLEQGKADIEKLQARYAQIKQTSEYINHPELGPRLQQVIAALDQNGISNKFDAAHQGAN